MPPGPDTDELTPDVHLWRACFRNYRSLLDCDIRFPAKLTYLVGPNGAGKSNVLDGLRLVSDALTTSLTQALGQRGGYPELGFRVGGLRASSLAITLHFRTRELSGRYRIELGEQRGDMSILEESCALRGASIDGAEPRTFTVRSGAAESSEPLLPVPGPDRLYLVTAANLPAFRPAFDILSSMRFYNSSPDVMRQPQKPSPSSLLARDGGNIASVLHRLSQASPESKKLVEDFLAVIAPGIVGVDQSSAFGSLLEALEFRQEMGERGAARFYAHSMSDGTLRALGVLVAAFQPADTVPAPIGIEEPEAAVHPAAAAVLRDALDEASGRRQILVTTHSPDLLDDPKLDPESVLAVEWRDGVTAVGRPDRAGLSVLKDRLFTAGELMRVNQLRPERSPTEDRSVESP